MASFWQMPVNYLVLAKSRYHHSFLTEKPSVLRKGCLVLIHTQAPREILVLLLIQLKDNTSLPQWLIFLQQHTCCCRHRHGEDRRLVPFIVGSSHGWSFLGSYDMSRNKKCQSSQRVFEMMPIQSKLDKEESEGRGQWIWSINENEALAISYYTGVFLRKWVLKIGSCDQRGWYLIGDFGGRKFLVTSRSAWGREECTVDILSIYSLG